MSSITTYCPTCGAALDADSGLECPRCSAGAAPAAQTPQLWGTGTGLLVWLASVALIVGLPLFFGIAYLIFRVVQTGHMPDPATLTQDKAFILVSIGSTFPAHILTILICWLVVTGAGKRPFLQTLGWGWHPQFKWVHAVGLAFLMMGVAIAAE